MTAFWLIVELGQIIAAAAFAILFIWNGLFGRWDEHNGFHRAVIYGIAAILLSTTVDSNIQREKLDSILERLTTPEEIHNDHRPLP